MTNETKAPTKEEVEQVAKYTEKHVTWDAEAIRLDIDTTPHTEEYRRGMREKVGRLKSAALLGAQVPGLVADNAALLAGLRECRDALVLGASTEQLASAHSSACDLAGVGDIAPEAHPGAALLAKHDAEMSARQARVADLERERDASIHGRDLETLRVVLGRIFPGVSFQWSALPSLLENVETQRQEAVAERDALRAQVGRLTHERDTARLAVLELVAPESKRPAALSAPPAETTCGPCADHECAVHVHADCEHCAPAETPAIERKEDKEPECVRCGRVQGGGHVIYACDLDEGGCGKDVCSDCSEDVGQAVVCLECHDRK